MKRTLILDTETTNLIQNSLVPLDQQPRIVEYFGWIIDDDDQIISEYHFRCNPGIPIPPESTKITGISDKDVRDLPLIIDFLPELIDQISAADSVCAHNLSFDMAIINCEFGRNSSKVAWPNKRICTVESTEWIKGYRLNLTALYDELFKRKFDGAHSARGDVQALTDCFTELRKRGYL